MAGEARGRFGRLSQEQKRLMADYLTARNEFLEASRTYNELLIAELDRPGGKSSKQVRTFASAVLGPARTRMKALQVTLLTESVDTDELAEFLPDLLPGLARSVNIPMLAAALNIDTDMADTMVKKSAALFRKARRRSA